MSSSSAMAGPRTRKPSNGEITQVIKCIQVFAPKRGTGERVCAIRADAVTDDLQGLWDVTSTIPGLIQAVNLG
jgi:hypothetical protein